MTDDQTVRGSTAPAPLDRRQARRGGLSLRYALRRLRQSPGFTLTAIASLAIGIGANTAIFTLVNAILLRQPPIREPERLVDVYLSTPDFEFGTLSYPDFRDLRDGATGPGGPLEAIAASRYVLAAVERDDEVESQVGEAVTGQYFTMLGFEPHLGRLIQPERRSRSRRASGGGARLPLLGALVRRRPRRWWAASCASAGTPTPSSAWRPRRTAVGCAASPPRSTRR